MEKFVTTIPTREVPLCSGLTQHVNELMSEFNAYTCTSSDRNILIHFSDIFPVIRRVLSKTSPASENVTAPPAAFAKVPHVFVGTSQYLGTKIIERLNQ